MHNFERYVLHLRRLGFALSAAILRTGDPRFQLAMDELSLRRFGFEMVRAAPSGARDLEPAAVGSDDGSDEAW